ncbi:VOC family protein [Pusillimonas caeni]|uniref:VOC family protein n=1 Tax=Pusillimonas caeni TaxID=1348472 RepID=UPI000E59963F|nr:VOC family protein [Pusillimonas caeni]TFL13189.1 VOC family protein [Pusillimonas caeni]
MSIAIQKLNHFAYRCKDAEETRHFYEDILGLPLYHIVRAENVPSTGEYNPFCHLFFKMNDGSCVAFFDLGDGVAPEPSPNTPSWVNHLALEVATHEELMDFKKRLETHGISVLGPTDHRTMESIYFFDPNGLRVELACWKVSMEQMEDESKVARAQLDEWTAQKRARLDA